jgi:hypothetical protein
VVAGRARDARRFSGSLLRERTKQASDGVTMRYKRVSPIGAVHDQPIE